MNKKIKYALAGMLTLSFAGAASIPAQAAYGDRTYTIVESERTQDPNHTLPDRVLPPPQDPRRAAAERWLQNYPAIVDSYRVLLRDEDGNHAQCVGMHFRLHTDRSWYHRLEIDSVAYAMDSLRLMRPEIGADAWPVGVGSCTPVADDIARSGTLRDHTLGLKYGPNVVRMFNFTAYGEPRTTPVQTTRGISTGFQDAPCRNAGFNFAFMTAKPGETVDLPALCSP